MDLHFQQALRPGCYFLKSGGEMERLNSVAQRQDLESILKQAQKRGVLTEGYVFHKDENVFCAIEVPIRQFDGLLSLIACWDVTSMRNAEMERGILKKTFDGLDDGIGIVDADGRIMLVNKAYEQIVNSSKGALVGMHVFDMISMGMMKIPIEIDVLRAHQPQRAIQRTGNGSYAMVVSNPVFDEEGRPCAVVSNLKDISDVAKTYEQLKAGKRDDQTDIDSSGIIFRSDKMHRIVEIVRQIAVVDTTLLLQGETGTGKDVVARMVHASGNRAKKPFIKVNCGAIPASLFESEFFGHEKGAFTGATTGKTGFVELANTGTLFLDEIGNMPMSIQVKLLTVIQDKCFYRVGGTKSIEVDVRVVAATNCDLETMVRQKTFREDLYYRLKVVHLMMPPLCKRTEEIIPLTLHFLDKYNQKYNKKMLILPEALSALRNHAWPGNVRELENVIEQMVVLGKGDLIKPGDLPRTIRTDGIMELAPSSLEQIQSLEHARSDFEARLVRDFHKRYPSSYKLAARLKISQSSANRLLKKYITVYNG